MSLDAYVRCTCIRDGRAKPHPLPQKLIFDEANAPTLSGDPTDEEWDLHDHWVAESCEHGGFLIAESLGNITKAQHLREFLRGLQSTPGPKFPMLLKKVVYDGTHTGDWIPSGKTADLLREVDLVLGSSDILTESEREFFGSMKRLCEASLATGNPIVF